MIVVNHDSTNKLQVTLKFCNFLFQKQNIHLLDFHYKDPYFPLTNSDDTIIDLENSYDIPLLIDEFDETDIKQSQLLPATVELSQAITKGDKQWKTQHAFNIYDDQFSLNKQLGGFIADESIMSNSKFHLIETKLMFNCSR